MLRRSKKYKYNPLKAPKPKEWLRLSEDKRIALIEEYHRKEGLTAPNMKLHATFNAIIENQAAMKDETPVAEAILRLRMEGLDRHEAIHAIGSVLAGFFFDTFQGEMPNSFDVNEDYFEKVRTLTKQKWYDEFG